jgi:hypothetical protein
LKLKSTIADNAEKAQIAARMNHVNKDKEKAQSTIIDWFWGSGTSRKAAGSIGDADADRGAKSVKVVETSVEEIHDPIGEAKSTVIDKVMDSKDEMSLMEAE